MTMRERPLRPAGTIAEIQDYIRELQGRAAEAQSEAKQELNPLFDDKETRPPRDFVDSSFLYMRSCDADVGSRPVPCPAFWLSPDLRVAPLSHLGAPTRQLVAGSTYRLTATVRNRGDLPVPSAKVEFWLTNPTLGFDTRFATKLGVAAGRVHGHGAAEVAIDYPVPPSLSGHRCLFARVFSFSPLDLPIDDFALNPVVDRHVAQLNLDIVGQGTTYALDWIHRRNARERLQVVPMAAATVRALRVETVTALKLVDEGLWKEVQGGLEIEIEPAPDVAIETRPVDGGVELIAEDGDAVAIEEQQRLTEHVLEALQFLEEGSGDAGKFKKLFREYRAMTAQTVRTRVRLRLPEAGLGVDEALALNVVRRESTAEEPTGGIGLFLVGEDRG